MRSHVELKNTIDSSVEHFLGLDTPVLEGQNSNTSVNQNHTPTLNWTDHLTIIDQSNKYLEPDPTDCISCWTGPDRLINDWSGPLEALNLGQTKVIYRCYGLHWQ